MLLASDFIAEMLEVFTDAAKQIVEQVMIQLLMEEPLVAEEHKAEELAVAVVSKSEAVKTVTLHLSSVSLVTPDLESDQSSDRWSNSVSPPESPVDTTMLPGAGEDPFGTAEFLAMYHDDIYGETWSPKSLPEDQCEEPQKDVTAEGDVHSGFSWLLSLGSFFGCGARL